MKKELKSFPSFLVALTTASSAASFGTLVKNCEKKFGISDSLSSFGVPLGIVMAVIISFITAIATPPIPGGAVIGYSMLFVQLGLPEAGLAIALAIDVVTDFLITSADIFCLPMALLGGWRSDMICLMRKNKERVKPGRGASLLTLQVLERGMM